MEQINLCRIVSEHPDCITNGSKLKAILNDIYPNTARATVNVLSIMASTGIIKEMIQRENISEFDKKRHIKKLEDTFGLSESVILDCYNLCEKAFSITYNSSDFEISGDVLIKYKGEKTIVTIPTNIKTIGSKAFEGNEKIKNVILPAGLLRIKEDAFTHCHSLENIIIPTSVIEIEHSAFFGCWNLSWVMLPSNIISVNKYAFNDCFSLKAIRYDGTIIQLQKIAKCFVISSDGDGVVTARVHCNDGIIPSQMLPCYP